MLVNENLHRITPNRRLGDIFHGCHKPEGSIAADLKAMLERAVVPNYRLSRAQTEWNICLFF